MEPNCLTDKRGNPRFNIYRVGFSVFLDEFPSQKITRTHC